MPDVLYKTVKSITQPARLVEVSTIKIRTERVTVNQDGTRVPHAPQEKTDTVEKWSVKAIVDEEYVGEAEEEFFFSTEAECAIIKPGYRRGF